MIGNAHRSLDSVVVKLRFVPRKNTTDERRRRAEDPSRPRTGERLSSPDQRRESVSPKSHKVQMKTRSLRTHHEPIFDPTPQCRPVLRAHRRIRYLPPRRLYRRLAPHVHDRLDVPPMVYPPDKVPNGIVFSGEVFGFVGGKGGEEVRVRVDDWSGRNVGAWMCGEGEVGFVRDGEFLVLVFAHVSELVGLSYVGGEGIQVTRTPCQRRR